MADRYADARSLSGDDRAVSAGHGCIEHLNPTSLTRPPRIPAVPAEFVARVVRRSTDRQLSKLILSAREPGAGEWHATFADAAWAEMSRRRDRAVRQC